MCVICAVCKGIYGLTLCAAAMFADLTRQHGLTKSTAFAALLVHASSVITLRFRLHGVVSLCN